MSDGKPTAPDRRVIEVAPTVASADPGTSAEEPRPGAIGTLPTAAIGSLPTVSDDDAIGSGATLSADDAIGSGATLSAAAAAPPRALPQLLDVEPSSYERRERLGAGGMGEVVVARDRRLDRLLAIKVSRASDGSMRARFTREAVLTARLQHPSIIPVHEAGLLKGEPFYAMKLVAGEPLSRLLAKTHTLDERLALIPNVIAVVDALAYAHSQRIIHRDLKPDNVIVGDYGETIVIDWGLAKELDDSSDDGDASASPHRRLDAGQTALGTAMGTPPYMSPEQAAGERVDERADVYGLGAMLYHVLCGTPPYRGATADEVLERVLAGPPPPLAARQDGIPKDLLAIVDKAMARDPATRYANAKQLADDLKRFERGQLVAAHAYSRRELLRRWLARHRAAVMVAAAAMIVVAVAVALWIRAEIRDLRIRAQRVAELLHRDDADGAAVTARLLAGDFAGAAEALSRQVEQLRGKDEADIEERYRARRAQRERVERIADFYKHARAATFLMGDEDKGAEAIDELAAALRKLGAIRDGGRFASGWWENPFAAELTGEQRRDMQAEAYRQVLLLAFMHFKEGALLVGKLKLFMPRSPQAAEHFRRFFEVLAQTSALERALGIRPAHVARVWQEMALTFLRGVGTDADVAAVGSGPLDQQPADPTRAENPVDHWLLGVGHFFYWQSRDTAVGKALPLMFPGALDYEHPLETAEQQLRLAIRLDPRQYWPHFMLGWALRSRGDLGGAELAFDTCVLLQPDNILGFGQRAQTLAERARQEPAGPRANDLMTLALADSDATVAMAPNHPVTHWSRGDLFRFLGQRDRSYRARSIESYTRAVELEEDMLHKFSRQVQLRGVIDHVTAEPAAETDPDAQVLLAFLALADQEAGVEKAAELADKALRLRPGHVRALAVRGTAHLERARLDLAAADFEDALRRTPDNHLAALGRARVLEARAAHRDALAAYDAVLRVAATPGHRIGAQLGRHRALSKLGRAREAEAALEAARAISPARRITP